jgi:hypothetical protein
MMHYWKCIEREFEKCACGGRLRYREYERRNKYLTSMAIAMRSAKISDIIMLKTMDCGDLMEMGGYFET